MGKMTKTGFDKYFDEQMRDPALRHAYEAARARIAMVDGLVRALDRARQEQGLSKAELARRIGAEPAAVRRLLTSPKPNPTMATFVSAAEALGLEIKVAEKRRVARSPRTNDRKRAASA
jgi:ribosome-binding protein aMBF1 (putative translation factor)